MQRTTRWIGLVWLALVLNVFSPVIGYARLPSSGSGELTLELCSAAGTREIVLAQAGSDHDASSFDHAGVPHCVYCPGLAANVALGSSLPALPSFVRTFAYRAAVSTIPEFHRKGIRSRSLALRVKTLRSDRCRPCAPAARVPLAAAGVGVVRASVFQSDLSDSIYSQTTVSGATTVTNISNVDHLRGRGRVRGVELAFSGENVGLKGLAIDASVSASNARILADVANPAYVGPRFPRIARMHANLLASYRFDEHWLRASACAARAGSSTLLDNSDVNPDVYGGTSSFTVVDRKARYSFDRHWSASLGIDNLADRRYYVFQPYPGRTFNGEPKWSP